MVKTLEEQKARVDAHLDSYSTPEEKNLYLQDLANRNETLYFRCLVDDIEKMAPLVYTPTVGSVCENFADQFRRARGNKYDRGEMSSMAHNWPHDDVHVIVVTDGSRILGLGDLGINGMGIPIGKLALYCAAGGIAPHRVLPVTLDVGTNNKALQSSSTYMGIPEDRISGPEYFDMVDEFMQAVFARWPNVIVQFEDFETPKAVPLLARYRDKYRMFNDDIQGTVLCVGAGSAGLGVCEQIVDGMVEAGLDREEAMRRFVVTTSTGALGKHDGKHGDPNVKRNKISSLTKPWINETVSDGTRVADIITEFKPNVLLGLSTVKDTFDEEIIRNMAAVHERPIIMPMSNPTDKAECTPAQAYEWTDGKAVVATGSPFLPVEYKGKTFIPSQCNNMYIFPGVGLACSVAGVSTITNKMLYLAAEACTNTMTQEEIDEGRTFPKLTRIREVSKNVAVAIIEEALREGLCTKFSKRDQEEGVANVVGRKMYFPHYVPLVRKE
eukprot:GSChrysophyteH2.ASY1.ANO1.841.1 assembled CDS